MHLFVYYINKQHSLLHGYGTHKKCIVFSNHSTTYKIHTDCESCALQEFKIAFQNKI